MPTEPYDRSKSVFTWDGGGEWKWNVMGCKIWGTIEMFITFIVEMVPCTYAYVKIHQIVHFKQVPFSFILQ